MQTAFIGGGNMAGALVRGAIANGKAAAEFNIVDLNEATRVAWHEAGVNVYAAPEARALDAALVVLAVKPQQLYEVAVSIAPYLNQQGVLTIAAGVRLGDLSRWLGGYTQLVRAMPNTPATVAQGVTGLYALPGVSAATRGQVEQLLTGVSACHWLEQESQLDIVTALSGSGPAYVFYFIEALEAAGRKLGLDARLARELAVGTVRGAAALAQVSPDSLARLRQNVTSKGGTTERAIQRLEQDRVKEALGAAVEAAFQRAIELGDELGAAHPAG